MRLFRIGTITAAPSKHVRVVVWQEDSSQDRIQKGQAPPEFFEEYAVDHRFEAMVCYHRKSNKIDHIEQIKRIGPEITDDEAWKFLQSIARQPDQPSSPKKGLEGS